MSARRVVAIVGGVLVLGAGAAAILLGTVGVEQTVSGGAQTSVCGVPVGVSVGEGRVSLLGGPDEPLAVGDRARLAPWCVVEVLELEEGDPDEDGGAHVRLRWTLW